MPLKTPDSPIANGHSSEGHLPTGVIPRELEEALDLDMDSDTPAANNLVESDEDGGPPIIDFEDNVKPPITPLNPFGSNSYLESSEPVSFTRTGDSKPILNDAQEQRLMTYLDNKTMEIQRLFVKFLSGSEDAPKWFELVHLIDNLLEFIWFGVTGAHGGVRGVYHWNVYNYPIDTPCVKQPSRETLELPINLRSNGCPSYLITIMGELITYIVKYSIDNYHDWIIALRILGKLDDTLCIFIDYGQSLISVTEKVRMNSIIQRTKLVNVELFEKFSTDTQRGFEPNSRLLEQREMLNKFQMFMGEVYEGLIDRTSI